MVAAAPVLPGGYVVSAGRIADHEIAICLLKASGEPLLSGSALAGC
jgi:tRNA A37 threonylcarbamoyladenosine synthetase subunit TsaC/SUA5/YrdC